VVIDVFVFGQEVGGRSSRSAEPLWSGLFAKGGSCLTPEELEEARPRREGSPDDR
jgi:hypothetical protein